MNDLKKHSDDFKFQFEKFLIGCDSIEEIAFWDVEENGEMDAFYSAELTSIVVRLIVADGNVTQKEVDYLNDIFGFEYTVNQLSEVYENSKDAINKIFDCCANCGLNFMRSINEKLADAYRDLILMACDIVIASDGVVLSCEVDLANKLKEKIK